MPGKKEVNCLDVQKFFETLAQIVGDREGVEIKVITIKERSSEKSA
ncbi:hypothetical protein EV210_11183 [Anaerospora hongkongensis]|uniref:Uncharacterized protein n=1 Tax=Anaerospora hongkongensis TaxID=244830 RepID=A0A4R1Q375_9FIRM|nr:hypothetical protein [Anaerospora hongkongensis]TCL35619.1 hypothetical protein EV210_11183 [Anaerospora hongkongensis]